MKRKSVSRGKSRSKSKEKLQRKVCKLCAINQKRPQPVIIRQALYRKYSGSQNHYYTSITNAILSTGRPTGLSIQFSSLKNLIQEKQTLKSFQSAGCIFSKLEQGIKLFDYHKDIPRNFIVQVADTIQKRHHAHRLLEYLRLAKLLGLSGEQSSSTTFIHSSRLRESFDRLIGQISSYNFSQESEVEENPENLMVRQIQDLLQQCHFQDKENELLKDKYETPVSKCRARRSRKATPNFQ